MKLRSTYYRLAISVGTVATLAATLGAGTKWGR
jgi:hypothetical protein